MTEDPGKGAQNVIEHQAGTVVEASEAAAVARTRIMTVEVAMIATITEKVDMTGKRIRNQRDLVAMIRGVTECHIPQGIVLEIMIGTGVTTVEIGTRCKLISLGFLMVRPYSHDALIKTSLRLEGGTCFFYPCYILLCSSSFTHKRNMIWWNIHIVYGVSRC